MTVVFIISYRKYYDDLSHGSPLRLAERIVTVRWNTFLELWHAVFQISILGEPVDSLHASRSPL